MFGQRPSTLFAEVFNIELTADEALEIDIISAKHITDKENSANPENAETHTDYLKAKWEMEDRQAKAELENRKINMEKLERMKNGRNR